MRNSHDIVVIINTTVGPSHSSSSTTGTTTTHPEQEGIGMTANNLNDDWWKQAVVYQIYPRSFKDVNGD